MDVVGARRAFDISDGFGPTDHAQHRGTAHRRLPVLKTVTSILTMNAVALTSNSAGGDGKGKPRRGGRGFRPGRFIRLAGGGPRNWTSPNRRSRKTAGQAATRVINCALRV
jgi:hypothetical protein